MARVNTDATDGTRDYASLSAWVSGEAGGTEDDAECFATGAHSADTTDVTINGFSSAVAVTAGSGHKALITGWDTDRYRLDCGPYDTLIIQDPNITLSGLQLRISGNNGDYAQTCIEIASSGSTGIEIDSCRIHANKTGTGVGKILSHSTAYADTTLIKNCLIVDEAGGASHGINARISNTTVYNTTVIDATRGVYEEYSSTIKAINVITQGCTDGFYGTFTDSDYNLSDIASDAPGTNSVESTLSFIGSGDYSLATGDTDAIDAGDDLSGTVDTDMAGTSRPQNSVYDIGAFEYVSAVASSAAITGTATASIDEADIVTGGETIIITLTGDTWAATVGADNAITTALIAGIDSAQAEATGWDAVVRANMDFNDVTRTSATVVTITLGAEATYDITTQETITVTVPATALVTSTEEVVASPSFTVDIVSGTTVVPPALHGLDNQFSQITANRLNGVLQ